MLIGSLNATLCGCCGSQVNWTGGCLRCTSYVICCGVRISCSCGKSVKHEHSMTAPTSDGGR